MTTWRRWSCWPCTCCCWDCTLTKNLIRKCDPEHVYNIDETGFHFLLLPMQTYVHKTQTNLSGTKNMKAMIASHSLLLY